MVINLKELQQVKGSAELPYKSEIKEDRDEWYRQWYREWAAYEYFYRTNKMRFLYETSIVPPELDGPCWNDL